MDNSCIWLDNSYCSRNFRSSTMIYETEKDFNDAVKQAESEININEILVVKPMDIDYLTGEILHEGHIYKVKDKAVGCNYRTQDNPKDANLDIEESKGVSVADFSDYVDNRDVIRKLMEVSNGKNAMTLRRYVSNLGVDDNIDDIDEDFDLDEIDDLEMLTMNDMVGQAVANANNQNEQSKQEEETADEAKQSEAEDKGTTSSVD